MKDFQGRKNLDFGMIQLRLWQATGNVESSFSNKMLATLDPSKPIWDANVLKMLGMKAPVRGTPEVRMSLAVVICDKICRWYEEFMKTEMADWFVRGYSTVNEMEDRATVIEAVFSKDEAWWKEHPRIAAKLENMLEVMRPAFGEDVYFHE